MEGWRGSGQGHEKGTESNRHGVRWPMRGRRRRRRRCRQAAARLPLVLFIADLLTCTREVGKGQEVSERGWGSGGAGRAAGGGAYLRQLAPRRAVLATRTKSAETAAGTGV